MKKCKFLYDLNSLLRPLLSCLRPLLSCWIGYLAVEDSRCVGTCAFKSPPANGRVEIAYFAFPGHEGQGVATRMAERLIELAQNHAPDIRICAQTLPETNASTRVLEKLGFKQAGELEHPEDGRVWEWELIRSDFRKR